MKFRNTAIFLFCALLAMQAFAEELAHESEGFFTEDPEFVNEIESDQQHHMPMLADNSSNGGTPNSVTGTNAAGESQMTIIDDHGNLKVIDKNPGSATTPEANQGAPMPSSPGMMESAPTGSRVHPTPGQMPNQNNPQGMQQPGGMPSNMPGQVPHPTQQPGTMMPAQGQGAPMMPMPNNMPPGTMPPGGNMPAGANMSPGTNMPPGANMPPNQAPGSNMPPGATMPTPTPTMPNTNIPPSSMLDPNLGPLSQAQQTEMQPMQNSPQGYPAQQQMPNAPQGMQAAPQNPGMPGTPSSTPPGGDMQQPGQTPNAPTAPVTSPLPGM